MLVICALTPALANAAITNVPGATEGDQSWGEAPNGAGSGGVNHGGGGGGGSVGGGSGGTAPVAAAQALEQLGPDGKAAAALANANRPPEQVKQGHNRPSPSSQAASPTDGGGGMGFWFPLLLVLTAFAAIAYGLRRRLYPA